MQNLDACKTCSDSCLLVLTDKNCSWQHEIWNCASTLASDRQNRWDLGEFLGCLGGDLNWRVETKDMESENVGQHFQQAPTYKGSIQGLGGTAGQKQERLDRMRNLFEVQVITQEKSVCIII